MKYLIWMAILTAMADPILLYVIYSTWGFWAAFLAVFVPIFVGNAIANATYRRAQSEGDPTVLLSIPARLLLWYPGPLTSVMGLILMTRFAQRRVAKYALGKIANPMNANSQVGPFSAQSSWVYVSNAGGPAVSTGPSVRPDGLKRTEGRVIEDDDQKQLPPAEPES